MDLSVDTYLESLGCELWPGEAFYLTDPKSRKRAADWYREFGSGYMRWKLIEQSKSSESSWAARPG